MKEHDAASVLRQLFGDNRAEWPAAKFKSLFVTPTYLKKLESMRPCLLVGGRGTGKTTSLQSLRYDVTLDRLELAGLAFADQEYLGVLVRMNKNRVRAFSGGTLPEEAWGRLFAHYFNLLVCLELARMTIWLQGKMGCDLNESHIQEIARDLGLSQISTMNELVSGIKVEISNLQLQVNNPGKNQEIMASIAESPLRVFCDVLLESGLLQDKIIFCCIDEYENLLDYQQAVINTYVKHAEPPLSYKIGVRKNGLRNRQTRDGQDLLRVPDDYEEIEIANEGFEYFARAVAETRLGYARSISVDVPKTLREFLQELSLSDEAVMLGSDRIAKDVIAELDGHDHALASYFSEKPTSETYFLRYWQETEAADLVELAKSWRNDERSWATRLGNYGYASLFWLSRGRKGVRIRKYYCGERTYLSLASGNIRYFLELIDSAIAQELDSNQAFQGALLISPTAQTLAAREVGKRRLGQIEGLADHGVLLKRLVLAIGKVFFELARSPNGKAPEVTSFVLSGNPTEVQRANELLSEGVGHLTFEVDPRTKATTSLEVRDDEFRLHRIFSAFFEISHRKKRRTTFDAEKLLMSLDEKPAKSISALLDDQEQSPEEDLPEQLAFFSAFYDGNK